MTVHHWLAASVLSASLVIAGCRGEKAHEVEDDARTAAASPASHDGARAGDTHEDAQAAPTGKVITIQLISDDKGNRFEPSRVEAHRGDVLRFTLASGVHNIDFFPDSNPGKAGLPPASDLLQLPGQTLDVPVNFAPGHYRFQCDPHAALGMTGRLEVEDDE